jgi:hypothetical protein
MGSKQRTKDGFPAPPQGALVWVVNQQGVITQCRLASLRVEPLMGYKGQPYTYCHLESDSPGEFPKFGLHLNQIYAHQEPALKDALEILEYTRNYFRNLKADYTRRLKKSYSLANPHFST